MANQSFRFPLERVLSVRRHEVEEARCLLASRIQERKQQEVRVAEARARFAALNTTGSQGKLIGLAVLRQDHAFRQDARQAVDAAQRVLENLQCLEEQARQELLTKRQAEEAIQTLADQARAQHRKKQEAATASFLDEQALAGFRRGRATKRQSAAKKTKKRSA